ncbi:MAG TPA: dihydrofolate reductase family protein [Thermomicrobiales bacterium]|nr:dihydrofolate reductase family protein [Thermomicrobiales bacterium]
MTIDGIREAVAQAKAAAGDQAAPVVGGASAIRQLLAAAPIDKLHIDIMPILLGAGLRLSDVLDSRIVRLQQQEALVVGARTSFRFLVGA